MKKIMLMMAALGLIVGCGQAFLPQPTKKPLKMSDVVGSWSWRAFRNMTENGPAIYYTASMDIKPDGTFAQEIRPDNQTNAITGVGTWTLEGASIHLRNVIEEDWDAGQKVGRWEPRERSWWMISRIGGKPNLVLFGGLFPDPDSYQELKKLR